jgi:cellulose 1,4-beta-cellobiosidase
MATLISVAMAQQAGHFEQEGSPTMTLKECTLAGGCVSKQAKLTLDSNWRWIHSTSGYENCYTGNQWNSAICTDPETCSQNCALEGISKEKYASTYGITEIDGGVKLSFVTEHQYGVNVGSRLYLMNGDDKYKLFYLKNREFSMDIDVSHLECGMNGAMYFVEMDEQGGKGLGRNQAGAKYGTGYCDAQCPHDIKFINGEANIIDWKPNPKDESNNMGVGKYGTCCAEMDIWEANSMATAYTPHPCTMDEEPQLRCEGTDCGDNDKGQRYEGVCDKDGCDINPFRMGNQNFYGRGPEFTVDTSKPMTQVTQFLTTDGTDDGDLSEIRRFYVQDGRIIHSPPSTILGQDDGDSITDNFCRKKKELFEDVNDFQAKGGNRQMGKSLDRGHVLALSLWDDVDVHMLWLDSAYPLDKPATKPGVKRGTCAGGESSTPTYVRNNYPDGYVRFANAAIGEIGSTLLDSSGPFPTTPPPPCVEGCSSRAGQNTPECDGKPKDRCQFMSQYENKCQWEECPTTTSPPTATPTSTTPSQTSSATPTSTTPATCELEINMKACVAAGGSFECQSCSNDIAGEPCCSCRGGEATTTETTLTNTTNAPAETTLTTTTNAPTETTLTTTTNPPVAGPCKSWCTPHTASWEKKCRWTKCAGCSPCSARRLRGSGTSVV